MAIAVTDFAALIDFARKEHVALTIVGPEVPLVAGVVDRFEAAGLKCFGPRAAGAQLEGSKAFTKDVPERATAFRRRRTETFTDFAAARDYARTRTPPIVIKADGLAAGKGVIIAATLGRSRS